MRLICIGACLLWGGSRLAGETADQPDLSGLGLSELEEYRRSIETEMELLSELSLRSGVGSIGYRSRPHDRATHTEWIQIHLDKEYPIDEIVLVPAIWRDTRRGFRADAFPQEFRIVAGSRADASGTVVAEFGAEDRVDAGIAPFIIPSPGLRAAWVRIEANRLSQRAFDGLYNLQLSEVMLFDGAENVALRQPVETSSFEQDLVGAWDQRFLVDGALPYLMNSASGRQSIAYVSQVGVEPALIIDLQRPHPISQIHLHAVDQSDTVPQAYAGDLGIPYHLVIEGALEADFADAQLLLEFRRESFNDVGPITMWRVPERSVRYVRIAAAKTSQEFNRSRSFRRIGFAEVELFSGDQNVARGKPAREDFAEFDQDPLPNATSVSTAHANPEEEPLDYDRPLAALTDGLNLYGDILTIREWTHELARRYQLESELPRVLAELDRRYARQKTNLNLLSWLTAALAAGLVILFLIDRIVRLREITTLRERFAADLHDELGANLHAIGLFSDLAENAKDSPEDLAKLHQRIRQVTERTGKAVRHCVDILEAEGLYTNFRADMLRAAQRIMANLEHDFSIEGEEFLTKLKPRTQVDLFLFYNECLVNISRHAEATRFQTHMKADAREIQLQISDNGRGLADRDRIEVPKSLRRRAHLLRAAVSVANPPEGGTYIQLRLKIPRWRLLPLFGSWKRK